MLMNVVIFWVFCGFISALLAMIGFEVLPQEEKEKVSVTQVVGTLIVCFIGGPLVLLASACLYKGK